MTFLVLRRGGGGGVIGVEKLHRSRVWAERLDFARPNRHFEQNSVAGIHQCDGRRVISGVRATDNDKSLSLGTRNEGSSSSSHRRHVRVMAPPLPYAKFEPFVGQLLRKHQVINVVIIRVVLIITCLTIIDFFLKKKIRPGKEPCYLPHK
jgi:hypothetical protein